MILCSDPRAQYLAHKADIDAAVARVLASNSYVLGAEVAAFEREFGTYLGGASVVGVGSCTDALTLALRALDVGAGEVVTTALSATATLAAIVAAGAVPVVADISDDTLNLSPAAVERALTPATRAIIAVHLHGCPAEMDALAAIARKRGLALIEDCAQASGARYRDRPVGTLGDIGCFSFYPTKNLGAVGDGGAVATTQPALAERIRGLRQYGWDAGRKTREPGVNSRLDEIQAAILRVKLPYLDSDNARRRAIAARYDRGLAGAGLRLPSPPPHVSAVFHQYVVRTRSRSALMARLEASGIRAGIHYAVPLHREPGYKSHLRAPASLPLSEHAADSVVSLPMYPELTDKQVDAVIASANDVLVAAHVTEAIHV